MVKRYEPVARPERLEDPQPAEMEEYEEGEWVSYKDYKEIRKYADLMADNYWNLYKRINGLNEEVSVMWYEEPDLTQKGEENGK